MKKNVVAITALLLALLVAVPAFAFEVKYGGLFYARWVSSDNILDGDDDTDDNLNYIDQRLRIFMEFIASENLKLVTGFEQDTLWGENQGKLGTAPGGFYRDEIGLELKHAYLDFAIPCTPMRARVGLQPISLLNGWILSEDFVGATVTAKFDPVTVMAGYVDAAIDNGGAPHPPGGTPYGAGVSNHDNNIDIWTIAVNYAQGPLTASLVGLYQNGHDAGAGEFNPNLPNAPFGEDDDLFDIGLSVGYKAEMFNVFANYVQNLGSTEDPATGDVDYRGFMVEGGGNVFFGPFTLTLGGFYTSGDDDITDGTTGDTLSAFVYPAFANGGGANSHVWSEIVGLGVIDDTSLNLNPNNAGEYGVTDNPSNIWTIYAGVAWQALETTKVSLNYYWINTSEDVTSAPGETDDSIGHEFDLYIDQKVVDGLLLRLVGAYLIADDAYMVVDNDDDAYELGAVLQWAF